jgi:hypothetical protein
MKTSNIRAIHGSTPSVHSGIEKKLIPFYTVLKLKGNFKTETQKGTPFEFQVDKVKKGLNKGKSCIRVTRDGKPRAVILSCCWGFESNCNKTYIHIYSSVISTLASNLMYN